MFKIILLTLFVNITSTIIAMIIGSVLGYKLFYTKIKLKKIIIVFNRTMMSLPPVVLGLFVFLMFRRSGTFGWMKLLYTKEILILTQTLLIIPIIIGHFYDLLENKGNNVMYHLKALGANKNQQIFNMLYELKSQLIIIFTIGLSRAVSEVGSIMIVGGNIKGKTRMMTTSISMLQSQGEVEEAIFLGIILLIIAFVLQYVLNFFKER